MGRDARLSWTIRPARVTDKVAVLAWRNDPGFEGTAADFPKVSPRSHAHWWRRHAMRKDRCRIWLLTCGKEVAGCVRLDRAPGWAWVSIGIVATHRGGGLGRQLLSFALSHIPRAWGTARVRAQVRRDNTKAQGFFSTCGFEPMYDVSETRVFARDMQ